ncbi:MAG: SH3 domain-containing protein [Synergistaceae bacterium]|jgi:hypothetical protein|nr:SH3 domain-containing protein [Synergistaceae bacterium]
MRHFFVNIVLVCCFGICFPGVAFAAPDINAEAAKGILGILDALDGATQVRQFVEEFGRPDSAAPEKPAAGESVLYQWTKKMGGDDGAYFIFTAMTGSGGVGITSRSVTVYFEDRGKHSDDYDRADAYFLSICTGLETIFSHVSKVKSSSGTFGERLRAYYPVDGGRMVGAVLTKTKDGHARVIFSRATKEEAEKKYMHINGENVNVREGPSTKTKVLRRVSGNEEDAEVLESRQLQNGEKYPWCLIRDRVGQGWVYGEFLKPAVEYSLSDLASRKK